MRTLENNKDCLECLWGSSALKSASRAQEGRSVVRECAEECVLKKQKLFCFCKLVQNPSGCSQSCCLFAFCCLFRHLFCKGRQLKATNTHISPFLILKHLLNLIFWYCFTYFVVVSCAFFCSIHRNYLYWALFVLANRRHAAFPRRENKQKVAGRFSFSAIATTRTCSSQYLQLLFYTRQQPKYKKFKQQNNRLNFSFNSFATKINISFFKISTFCSAVKSF